MDENITENKILDFNSALNILDKASESFKVDAWIPSIGKYLSFKELDAKQQKSLLSAAMDTSVYNTSFIKAFYNILKENILSEDSNIIDSLTLSDKTSIALTLRSQISKQINVNFDENNTISQKYDILPFLEKIKSYKSPETTLLESDSGIFSLKVEIVYPTIKIEFDYDNQLKTNKKSEDLKSAEDIQRLVSDAFLGETSKYINRIWINDEEVVLSSLNFDRRINIVEKLPSNLIQKIIDQISSWKKDMDEILTVKHEDYVKTINIDSLLFLN
jgi:hypothetical protein